MPARKPILCKVHNILYTPVGNSNDFTCKPCRTEYFQRRRQRIKQQALEFKGGKCERCGYSKCAAALEFHHVSPEHKDFTIGDYSISRSWEKIKVELDKCILVCSNCHREIENCS